MSKSDKYKYYARLYMRYCMLSGKHLASDYYWELAAPCLDKLKELDE